MCATLEIYFFVQPMFTDVFVTRHGTLPNGLSDIEVDSRHTELIERTGIPGPRLSHQTETSRFILVLLPLLPLRVRATWTLLL